MSCLYPKIAYLDTRVTPRKVLFKPKPTWLAFDSLPEGVVSFTVPCGKCFGCLKQRAFEITVRAVAESRMHFASSFITLTVDDEHLQEVFPRGLHHRPWQLFAKKLRNKIGPFSFLMCGEYGSRTMRPHYHAVIFGHLFQDPFCLPDGSVCPSRLLHDAWSYGHVQVSDINTQRIAYVAGYTCKDYALGRDKRFWIARGLGLPYVKWSRRPALGLRWLTSFQSDLVKDNVLEFILDGRPCKISGRYFLERLRLHSPELYDTIKSQRLESLAALRVDSTVIMRHYDDNRRRVDCQIYRNARKAETADL